MDKNTNPELAQEHFVNEEWKDYELWDKTVARIKKRRLIWILTALFVFLILSSIPIIIERSPKWRALQATKELALKLSELKVKTALEHTSFFIKFDTTNPGLKYRVQKIKSCTDNPVIPIGPETENHLLDETVSSQLQFISKATGSEIDIPRLTEEFCFDALSGSSATENAALGVGIIPVTDLTNLENDGNLTNSRNERAAILLITGNSAEFSFN
jgi:hypothetical protein